MRANQGGVPGLSSGWLVSSIPTSVELSMISDIVACLRASEYRYLLFLAISLWSAHRQQSGVTLCISLRISWVLEAHEWQVLRCKFEPKNRSTKPPTLRQVVRWIDQLGGFLARTGDGEPGLKTLWRGLGKFHDLLEGVQLAAHS
jgi:hypothetical protein